MPYPCPLLLLSETSFDPFKIGVSKVLISIVSDAISDLVMSYSLYSLFCGWWHGTRFGYIFGLQITSYRTCATYEPDIDGAVTCSKSPTLEKIVYIGHTKCRVRVLCALLILDAH